MQMLILDWASKLIVPGCWTFKGEDFEMSAQKDLENKQMFDAIKTA